MRSPDAILAASKDGDYDLVLALLDDDPALATATSMLGAQPIHAAHLGGHDRIVELLLKRGVELDFFLASELGMLDLVIGAVDSDPDLPRAFSLQGSTALHRSCYWGQTAVARFLLEHGADPNAVTRDTFLEITPLGCAVATPDVPNPSDREDVVLELVILLIANGADVNARRRDGLTALHGAAYRGHLQVIGTLLEHGADRAIRGYHGVGQHAGQTAAEVAAVQGQEAAAVLLADRQPDIREVE
jgi:ankyrin repeat protein